MLCLDVLWGAPVPVLGCHGSEGTAAPMFSALELLVLGTAPIPDTAPQIGTAGHTRGDGSPGPGPSLAGSEASLWVWW